jgi:hypothetical protein
MCWGVFAGLVTAFYLWAQHDSKKQGLEPPPDMDWEENWMMYDMMDDDF